MSNTVATSSTSPCPNLNNNRFPLFRRAREISLNSRWNHLLLPNSLTLPLRFRHRHICRGKFNQHRRLRIGLPWCTLTQDMSPPKSRRATLTLYWSLSTYFSTTSWMSLNLPLEEVSILGLRASSRTKAFGSKTTQSALLYSTKYQVFEDFSPQIIFSF